jgi:hypothetical protein
MPPSDEPFYTSAACAAERTLITPRHHPLKDFTAMPAQREKAAVPRWTAQPKAS